MYNGSAKDSDLVKEEFICIFLLKQLSYAAFIPHSCMHASKMWATSFSSGNDLKKIFLEAGGNLDVVEMSVKKWVSEKKSSEEVTSRVTKRMLKEKYFWDEL